MERVVVGGKGRLERGYPELHRTPAAVQELCAIQLDRHLRKR